MNIRAGQIIRSRARSSHKHVALFGGERTKVRGTHAKIDGQVPEEFVIILDKKAP